MADLEFVVGDTGPSVTGALTKPSDGSPLDLTSCTVRFQMRFSGYTELTVDAAAVITDHKGGLVRYDWAEHDLDMAGDYTARWRIYDTSGGEVMHSSPANTITVGLV